jgi:hypothetical protein
MAEPPEGPADDPREPPEQPDFDEEPSGHEPGEDVDGLFDEPRRDEEPSEGDRERHLFEEPQIAEPSGEPHTEETAVVPRDAEADRADESESGSGEGDRADESETGSGEADRADESEAASGEGEAEEGELAAAEDAGPATELHLIDEDGEEAALRYHDIEETDYHSLEEAVHTPEEIRQRRLADKAARRRAGRQRLGVLVVAVAVIVVIVLLTTGGGGKSPPAKVLTTSPIARAGTGLGYLAFGSSSALPANILIADRGNNRLVAISSSGQQVWSSPPLSAPSDAYVTSTGRSITVTEHSNMQVYVFGVASGKVDYHYGHAHVAGSGLNRLHDPATAQFLPDGRLVIADKANCRILIVTRPSHHHVKVLGKVGTCVHNPPHDFANPSAAFPTPGGGLVVTEHTPPWVDILGRDGTLVQGMQPAGLSVPYDANEYAPGKLIATNYAHPGAVVEFDSSGKVTWTYNPTKGAGVLDYPTLAQVLPDGNILVSDTRNDRVVVIDAATKKIIWQYGHRGQGGNGPGFLLTPDSAVLVPSGSG